MYEEVTPGTIRNEDLGGRLAQSVLQHPKSSLQTRGKEPPHFALLVWQDGRLYFMELPLMS